MNNYFDGKTVLVTGGAGLIGSHLAARLQGYGANVVVADYMNGRSSLENLTELGFQPITDRNFFDIDLKEKERCDYLFETVKPDIVYHLAARVSGIDGALDEPLQFLDNIDIDKNTFKAAAKLDKPPVFIYASTACVYPEHITDVGLKESDTWKGSPHTMYGRTKLYMEDLLQKFYINNNHLNASIVRFHNVYGPNVYIGKGAQSIPSLILKALKNGEIRTRDNGKFGRDYVYVTDVVDALVDDIYPAMVTPESKFRQLEKPIIQIGSGKNTESIKLADIIAEIVKKKRNLPAPLKVSTNDSETVDGGEKARWGDMTLYHQTFDRLPATTTLEEGIEKTIDWAIKRLKIDINSIQG